MTAIILGDLLHPEWRLYEPRKHGQVGYANVTCHRGHGLTQLGNSCIMRRIGDWWRPNQQGWKVLARFLQDSAKIAKRGFAR
jgi:hypothetical protein